MLMARLYVLSWPKLFRWMAVEVACSAVGLRSDTVEGVGFVAAPQSRRR